jgi:hypothetical protein
MIVSEVGLDPTITALICVAVRAAAPGDRTAWLPPEDSNLEMSKSKSPFEMSPEFPAISEQIATGDFSRRS